MNNLFKDIDLQYIDCIDCTLIGLLYKIVATSDATKKDSFGTVFKIRFL